MASFASRSSSNRLYTSSSDSPCHLLTKSEEGTEENVPSASVATASAKKDYSLVSQDAYKMSSKI